MENEQSDKIEHRAVIKFLTLENVSPSDIVQRMQNVYGQASPSYATVKRWAAEFKRGRTSLLDDQRSGRPCSATSDQKVDQVSKIVENDRRVKVREIAGETALT